MDAQFIRAAQKLADAKDRQIRALSAVRDAQEEAIAARTGAEEAEAAFYAVCSALASEAVNFIRDDGA